MSAVLPLQEVVEADGTRVRLGTWLGQVGEGAIYELEGRPYVVAKIFHQPLPEQCAEKIRATCIRVSDHCCSRRTANSCRAG